MDWMQQVGDVLGRYANGTSDHSAAERDFEQVTQAAPRPAVAAGIADAFRSGQTPPFPKMLSQLFGESGGGQRATLLNTLASTLGPGVVSQILARRGVQAAPQADSRGIDPALAQQIPNEAVEDLAAEAERKDPSIIDRVSHFYADQPALVKKLGGAALVIAMAKLAQMQTRQ
jgi:hypothetical protein